MARFVQGWKLLLMLRRMFLFRRLRMCRVKAKLVERFKVFFQGQWEQLM